MQWFLIWTTEDRNFSSLFLIIFVTRLEFIFVKMERVRLKDWILNFKEPYLYKYEIERSNIWNRKIEILCNKIPDVYPYICKIFSKSKRKRFQKILEISKIFKISLFRESLQKFNVYFQQSLSSRNFRKISCWNLEDSNLLPKKLEVHPKRKWERKCRMYRYSHFRCFFFFTSTPLRLHRPWYRASRPVTALYRSFTILFFLILRLATRRRALASTPLRFLI